MRYFLTKTVLFSSLFFTNSFALAYKGQIDFSNDCVKCHANAQKFVGSKTVSQWKETIGDNGIGIAKIHLKSNKAHNSWKYFYGEKYKNEAKDLEDFFVKYAKDSGNISVFE